MSERELILTNKIIELTRGIGLALGALETVKLCPYDFNQDGIVNVIKELRKICDEPNHTQGEIE